MELYALQKPGESPRVGNPSGNNVSKTKSKSSKVRMQENQSKPKLAISFNQAKK